MYENSVVKQESQLLIRSADRPSRDWASSTVTQKQVGHTAVQLPHAHLWVPDVAKVVRMVGVMVAVDEPDPLPNRFQLDVQRLGWLQVAQQDHGAGVGLLSRINDVLPLAVRVAAEEERAGHVCAAWGGQC